MNIKHSVGENEELYRKYGISGGEHRKETEELCEVIRDLEYRIGNLSHKVTCQACGFAKDGITLFVAPGGIASLWICLDCMDGLIKAGWRARPVT